MPFGRYDLRDPAKEKFGKPTIGYPDNSVLHPTLTESLNKRKDSTAGYWPYLTLSERPGAQGCYLTKQASTKGDDDGSNINMIFDRLPGVVKTTYPIDETYGIGMKVQTQVVIARDNPPWVGERFSGEFTLTALPSANETVVVGSITYKFIAALTGAANEVLIAGTIAGTLFNLASAINLDWGIGLNFGAGTVANSEVVAWFSINTLVVADISSPSATFATTETCANGSWAAATATTALFIEQKEIDVNRVYRISSRVVLVPPDVSYWMTKDVSLPDTLISADMVWDVNTASGGSVQSRNAVGGAKAQAQAANFIDGGVALEILNGFRGAAKAELTRHFTLSPPGEDDITAPTVIKPALGTAVIRVKGGSQDSMVGDYGCSFSGNAKIAVKTQHIGPVLTAGVMLGMPDKAPADVTYNAEAPDGGTDYPVVYVAAHAEGHAQLTMPASVPTAIESGDTITESVAVIQMRLGIYMIETIIITVP